MRPLPSIRTQPMPRRASWAARMVPEKPPPMIATGTARSDFIVGPVLRIGRVRLAALDVVVNAGHRSSARLGEPARYDRMDQDRTSRADQFRGDFRGANPMLRPSHSERAWMLEEQTVHHP